MLDEKLKLWERDGLIRPLWTVKYDNWAGRVNSVSDRLSYHCDLYRLLPWWNPIKWWSRMEIQRIRGVAQRLKSEYAQLIESQER